MAEYRRVESQSTGSNTRSISNNSAPQRPPVPNRPTCKDSSSLAFFNGSTDSNELKKPNKNMPLLKKFGSKNSSSRNNGNRDSLVKNNRSNSSNYTELNAEVKSRGPTIIRSSTSSNVNIKKKVAPPRPPPPKSKSGPPSYEDVLKSDFKAFIGELSSRPAPNIPAVPRPQLQTNPNKRLPPPVTRNSQLVRPPRPPSTSNALIDFDPFASSSQLNSTVGSASNFTNNANLLDLDDIFSCNDFPPTAFPVNSGTSSNFNSNSVVQKAGEHWLQSCLQDNTSKQQTNVWETWDNSPSNSPEPPTTSPPPVPQYFSFTDNHFDEDLHHELAPPLPPRPTKAIQITKPHAMALFDYTAQQADELNFKVNEKIMLVDRVNSDWLYGYTDRSAGLFPSNFVNILVPLPDSNQTNLKPETETRCRAMYDYNAENSSDLSFRVGDVVTLESKDENSGWYKGTLNGRSGFFPSSYVEIISFSNSKQDNALSKQAERFGVAIYDFDGETGELSFREGQRITVVSQVNADWSIGRLQGSIFEGRFPTNFVEFTN